MDSHQVSEPPIDVVISSSTGAISVRVRGEIDVATVDVLRRVLDVVEDSPELVIDLSATTFVDIAGVRALATCARRRRAFGRDILLLAPPPGTEWILQTAPFAEGLRWEPRLEQPASSEDR